MPNAAGGGTSTTLPKSSEFVKEYRQRQPGFNYKQTRGLAYFGDLPFTSGPVYFGAGLLFLFVLGLFLVDNRYKWWILAIFILSMIMSMGKNFSLINDLFYHYLPFYNKLRSPNMATTLAQLVFLIPAMLVVQKLLNNKAYISENKEKIKKALLYSAGITGGLVVLILLAGGSEGVNDSRMFGGAAPESVISDRGKLVRNDALRSLFFIGAFFALLWFYFQGKIKSTLVLILLTALTLIDLWAIDKRYLNDKNFLTKSKIEEVEVKKNAADEFILQDKENFRVYDLSNGNAFNSARASRFHRAVGGSHPAILLAPAIIGLLGYANLPDHIHTRHALPDKHINLPQLLNDFLRLVPLVRHSQSSVS